MANYSYSSNQSLAAVIVILFWLMAASFGSMALVGHFISKDNSVALLEAVGFSEITLKDKAIWFVPLRGCDVVDAARFTFEAKNPIGNYVKIRTCEGLFKDATMFNY